MQKPFSRKAQKFNKTQQRLRRLTGFAIADFDMIQDGDRVMVCVSGGKDSFTLLDMLLSLQQSAPVKFDICAVNLDQKQPGFPVDVLPDYFRKRGISFDVIEQDTYSIVKRVIPENETFCGLCSRLRRGILYNYAEKNGMTKIALGHHRDDIIETFFLNLFHGGKLSAMPAKLRSDDGKHVLIRPLAYCKESDIEIYAEGRDYPIIPCNLCGSQEGLKRNELKQMLQAWDKEAPGRLDSIFASLKNIAPSHLLDRKLFDFLALSAPQADPAADLRELWLQGSTDVSPRNLTILQ